MAPNSASKLAAQLEALKHYKVLCERKILDMAPGHPLPIKPEHIGKGIPKGMVNELSSLRARIEKLSSENKQLKAELVRNSPNKGGNVERLRSENKKLEELLHAEMAVKEEQEKYVESLQETVRGKLSRSGNDALKRHSEALLRMFEMEKQLKEKYGRMNAQAKEVNELKEELEEVTREKEEALALVENLKQEVSLGCRGRLNS